jgi:hypothetical protein
VAGAASLGRLVPLNRQTVQSIVGVLGGGKADQDDATGFGGNLFAVRKGLGYTSVAVHGFAFNGRLAWVRVSVEFDSSKSGDIRAWDAGGGPALYVPRK